MLAQALSQINQELHWTQTTAERTHKPNVLFQAHMTVIASSTTLKQLKLFNKYKETPQISQCHNLIWHASCYF